MKKILLLIFLMFPISIFAIETSARSAILMDMDSNKILYEKNINEQRSVASISKIMTAVVAIESGKLDDKVTIGREINTAYGSGIYIKEGEVLTLRDLLYGLMLRSGNDAAIQIANTVGGSMENFVKMMNDTAKSIGMKNTNFINSSGLENDKGEGNTSTSYDMALLMSYAMKNEVFKKIVSTQKKVVKTNYKTYVWYNKNKLLKNYKFCTGGKTGFTEKARRTLVTTASKDNMNFVVVTLNDPNDFSDHLNLYEEYFKKYKSYKVLDSKDKFSNEKYYIKNDKYVALTQDEFKSIKKEVVYYDNNVSDIVGFINIKLNDKLLAKEYIYEKKETVKKKKKMNFIEKIKKLFD